jgi:hypothetical protein
MTMSIQHLKVLAEALKAGPGVRAARYKLRLQEGSIYDG